MDTNPLEDIIPGLHYRPPTTPQGRFNQRSVAAFLVPAVLYSALTLTTPHTIGESIWAAVALLVIPAIGGLIVHSVGEEISTQTRALRAFILLFIIFGAYGLVNMSSIHDRIHSTGPTPAPMLPILIAAAGYALVAGTVAALFASLPAKHVETGW